MAAWPWLGRARAPGTVSAQVGMCARGPVRVLLCAPVCGRDLRYLPGSVPTRPACDSVTLPLRALPEPGQQRPMAWHPPMNGWPSPGRADPRAGPRRSLLTRPLPSKPQGLTELFCRNNWKSVPSTQAAAACRAGLGVHTSPAIGSDRGCFANQNSEDLTQCFGLSQPKTRGHFQNRLRDPCLFLALRV